MQINVSAFSNRITESVFRVRPSAYDASAKRPTLSPD